MQTKNNTICAMKWDEPLYNLVRIAQPQEGLKTDGALTLTERTKETSAKDIFLMHLPEVANSPYGF